MSLSPQEQELRDRFFQSLLATATSLESGPDPEVTLEALIEASEMLAEHLKLQLTQLRQEQAE
jgi:hypothetical protein